MFQGGIQSINSLHRFCVKSGSSMSKKLEGSPLRILGVSVTVTIFVLIFVCSSYLPRNTEMSSLDFDVTKKKTPTLSPFVRISV